MGAIMSTQLIVRELNLNGCGPGIPGTDTAHCCETGEVEWTCTPPYGGGRGLFTHGLRRDLLGGRGGRA